MRKFTALLTIITLLASMTPEVFAKGKIQNEDVKSVSDIQSSNGTITGNLSTASACITSVSFASGSAYANLGVGQYVYDSTTPANINSGVTIAGLPGTCSAGQIQMSSNPAGNATGDTITFGGQTSQLINDTKIYVTANSINTQLSTAITNGVIGGGGGGGVQLLSNPSFEIGTNGNPPSSWTITAGTGSLSTSVFYVGTQAEVITASSQTSSIAQDVTPTQAYSGVNMEASCKVKTSLTNVQVCARTGGSDLSSCTTVPSTNTWQYVPMNFIGPSSGSMGVDVKMTSSGTGSFTLDDCYVGPARNLSQVSQAQLLGSVVITGCASNWQTTGTSFANPSTQSGCVYTTSGQAQAPSTNIPAIKFASVPPGQVVLEYEGLLGGAVTTGKVNYFQFTDGTNVADAISQEYHASDDTDGLVPSIRQMISYTTPQSNVTFQLQSKSDSGGTARIFGATANPGVIRAWLYPSQSQTAFNPSIAGIGESRVNTYGGLGSTNTSIAYFTTVGKSLGSDITYNHSTSLGDSWTINNTGVYSMHLSCDSNSTSGNALMGISVNSANLTTDCDSLPDSERLSCAYYSGNTNQGTRNADYSGNFNQGDIIRVHNHYAPSVAAKCYFNIAEVRPGQPAPILVGSVTSASAAAERVDRAFFSGNSSDSAACTSNPCTINSQSGSWLTSVTWSSTGIYVLNIAAGEFSGVPSCTCASGGNGADTFCETSFSGQSATSVTLFTRGSGFSLANTDVSVICAGPH
jgi:hypothetical protein